MLGYSIQNSDMFRPIDNTPNTYSKIHIAPVSLGKSGDVIKAPKPSCGCKNTVASVSGKDACPVHTTIVENGMSGYDILSVSPDIYAATLGELVPIEPYQHFEEQKQSKQKEHPQYANTMITHFYITSVSIIGLYALYRLIHKTR